VTITDIKEVESSLIGEGGHNGELDIHGVGRGGINIEIDDMDMGEGIDSGVGIYTEAENVFTSIKVDVIWETTGGELGVVLVMKSA